MFIQTKILKRIHQHPDKIICSGRRNIELYRDVSKLYHYLLHLNIDTICIVDLEPYEKIIAILCSMFYNITIYYYKSETTNLVTLTKHDFNLMNTNEDTLKIHTVSNGGNIHYEIKNNKYITNWDKITIFYKRFKSTFRQLITTVYDAICLENVEILSLYFIPCILLYPTDIQWIVHTEHSLASQPPPSSIFYIGQGDINGIFICHQHSTYYPENNVFKMFFSLTLNQFLLYDVKLYLDKIVGRLLPIYKLIRVNDQTVLLYNQTKMRLPTSYRAISKHKIEIIKKMPLFIRSTQQTYTFKLSHMDTFYIRNTFYKRIYIKSCVYIDKLIGFKLFEYLLEKFPVLNSSHYEDINVGNYYLYNELIQIDHNLFSLYIKTDKKETYIILFTSYMFNYMERRLLKEVNYIINDLFAFKTIPIIPEIIQRHTNTNWLVQLKCVYICLIYILPILITNMFRPQLYKKNPKRKQMIYTFDRIDIEKLKQYANTKNQDYKDMFKQLLLTTLQKFFKDKLILFNNRIIPLTKHILDIEKKCMDAEYVQYYLVHWVFFYLNTYGHIYPFTFIQIDEIEIDSVDKYNIKCDAGCIPIQIQYYITDNKIGCTISATEDYDIIKYIVPEMFSELMFEK